MSDNTTELNEMVNRRTKRAIAIILSFKEEHCDKFLTEQESAVFRKIILDQLNEVSDLGVDCIKQASNQAGITNDFYMNMLDKIHDNTQLMVSSLEV